jgi:hypothetical protein
MSNPPPNPSPFYLTPKPQCFSVGSDCFGPYYLDEFVNKITSTDARPGSSGIATNVPPEICGSSRTLENTLGCAFRPLPKPTGVTSKSVLGAYRFDRYVSLLLDLVRNYNRGLYRLRRAHCWNDHCVLMDALTDDPLPLPPMGASIEVKRRCFHPIEDAYVSAVRKLTLFVGSAPCVDPIAGESFYFYGDAEFIRVNDYIVSVRIGGEATEDAPGKRDPREPAYSSSSQISISSPFSSYSSNSSWYAGPDSSSSSSSSSSSI